MGVHHFSSSRPAKMKLTYVLTVILGAYVFQIRAQDCPPGEVCPLNVNVRSDGGGMCETPEGDSVRNEIQQDLSMLLTSNSQVLSALKAKYFGLYPNVPATSCAEIYSNNPDAPNGYYYVGDSVRQFCRFDFSTPGPLDENGWGQLAFTNMTDPLMSCPGTLELVETGGARFCRKGFNSFGCASVFYQPTSNVTRLYGRIYGIQTGTLDIQPGADGDIESVYVDGVSLTYGAAGSRQHIWTFFGYTSAAFNDCPCSTNPTRTTPSFVGENYFCESGTADVTFFPITSYIDDPIWDAQNCELNQIPCCDRGPWFYREFDVSFNGPMELRLCSDQATDDEDVSVQLIDLWFQ